MLKPLGQITEDDIKSLLVNGVPERKYWKQPFVKDGKVLSWDQAMKAFRDRTGRPGPSAWELGTYPKGHEDFPVSGVSWYEAAAYAEFAGKSLPTFYHWRKAAGNLSYSDILRLSNFSGKGPSAAGSHRGQSPYGNHDMAGNVREWCWTEAVSCAAVARSLEDEDTFRGGRAALSSTAFQPPLPPALRSVRFSCRWKLLKQDKVVELHKCLPEVPLCIRINSLRVP
jgi:hypothetical protein